MVLAHFYPARIWGYFANFEAHRNAGHALTCTSMIDTFSISCGRMTVFIGAMLDAALGLGRPERRASGGTAHACATGLAATISGWQ